MPIPDGLTRQHIELAIQDLNDGIDHSFGEATGYELRYHGKRYAPKAVVGIARRHLTGTILDHRDFSGGEQRGQSNFVLRELGFEVQPIAESLLGGAYILTWNQSKWNDWDYDDIVSKSQTGEPYTERWSTGNRKTMQPGVRVYLLRQGDNQGIIGSGYITSEVFSGPHWDGSGKTANFSYIEFDTMLPVEDGLPVGTLLQHDLGVPWNNIYASGNAVPPEYVAQLESLWTQHLLLLGRLQDLLPNEVVAPSQYVEGAVKQISVNSYERNAKARTKCIERWGLNCVVCGFNFETVYGELGKGFIHVHHLKDLASIGEQYCVDPINDLRPVCPNCHAMLHRQKKTMSIDELQQSKRPNAEASLPAG